VITVSSSESSDDDEIGPPESSATTLQASSQHTLIDHDDTSSESNDKGNPHDHVLCFLLGLDPPLGYLLPALIEVGVHDEKTLEALACLPGRRLQTLVERMVDLTGVTVNPLHQIVLSEGLNVYIRLKEE
jgi:hypothetical protein